MLSRILGTHLFGTENIFIRFMRTMRPSIKIGEERFQLTLDLRQFTADELSVKAHPEYVIVEGNQERESSEGLIVRQFVRKYKLPKGCLIKQMETKFSPDGVLTISAPRVIPEPEIAKDILIPIQTEGKMRQRLTKKKVYPEYCKRYPKVKPKPPKDPPAKKAK